MEQQFDTPLGIVKCGLNSNDIISLVGIKKYENGQSKIFKTIGYRVEIISFKIRLPLYNGENVAESRGWIFRIEKINSADEMLEAYCMLSGHLGSTEFDSATGEHLDAIQADNSEWTLHIGTEDGEVLNARAENDDWFPPRLKNDVDFCQSITEMK